MGVTLRQNPKKQRTPLNRCTWSAIGHKDRKMLEGGATASIVIHFSCLHPHFPPFPPIFPHFPSDMWLWTSPHSPPRAREKYVPIKATKDSDRKWLSAGWLSKQMTLNNYNKTRPANIGIAVNPGQGSRVGVCPIVCRDSKISR